MQNLGNTILILPKKKLPGCRQLLKKGIGYSASF